MSIIAFLTGIWVGFMAGYETADDKIIGCGDVIPPVMIFGDE